MCTTTLLWRKEDSHSYLLLTNEIGLISILNATMTDKWTIAAVAVAVVTAIFAIPTFLIGSKRLLVCFRKKGSRTSHEGLHYIKTFIFASNILFFVQAQPTNLFCQHLPMTAIEWTISRRIMKHNSSNTTVCPVSLVFMSFYPRSSTADMRVLS